MSRERLIEVAALNVAANPHPPGTYLNLLTSLSKYRAPFRGSDRAKITKPQETGEDGVYAGRILVWTELNLNEPWLDIDEETSLDEALKDEISIPAQARPNFRVFNYVFVAAKHRMYFETHNEFGQHLGPGSALRVIGALIDLANLSEDLPETNITVVPAHGAVDAVLALGGLRMLEITVVLPNPDADAGAEERIFQRLERANAGKVVETYTKRRGAERLIATQEIKDLAHVAASNGEVVGVGQADGQRRELSTRNIPKREKVSLAWGRDFLSRLRQVGFF